MHECIWPTGMSLPASDNLSPSSKQRVACVEDMRLAALEPSSVCSHVFGLVKVLAGGRGVSLYYSVSRVPWFAQGILGSMVAYVLKPN